MVSRPKPRVFLDTNVLFSGLHSPRGAPSRIVELAAEEEIVCVVSQDVLRELTRTVHRKAPQLLGRLQQFLTNVPIEVVAQPREEDLLHWLDAGLGSDAPILAAAIRAGVDHFCTGDRRVLKRGQGGALGGLRVVPPAELLSLLPSDGHLP